MSITFSTKVQTVPNIHDLISRISGPLESLIEECSGYRFSDGDLPVIICPQLNGNDDYDYFIDSHRFFFWIPYISTRAIEVWLFDDEMHIDVMPFSAPLEFDLALRFLEEFQSYGATTINCDVDNEPIGYELLRKKFSPQFYELWSRSCLRQLMTTTEREVDSNFTILTSHQRNFYFGPNLASVLALKPNEDERLRILMDWMATVQFWCLQDGYASCISAEVKKHFNGVTSATIKPNISYVVPKVDELHFEHNGRIHKISRQAFVDRFGAELPSDQFTLFDEFQFMLHLSSGDMEYIANGSAFSRPSLIPFARPA